MYKIEHFFWILFVYSPVSVIQRQRWEIRLWKYSKIPDNKHVHQ